MSVFEVIEGCGCDALVLDADGVPTKVGDVVYEVGSGKRWVVDEVGRVGSDEYVNLSSEVLDEFGFPAEGVGNEAPDMLTHRKPDAQERIDEDAQDRGEDTERILQRTKVRISENGRFASPPTRAG